jgi:DNA-binding Xre family transcriptional regulator
MAKLLISRIHVIGHNLLGAYLIQRILKAKELKNAVVVSSMSLHVKSTGIKTQEVPSYSESS